MEFEYFSAKTLPKQAGSRSKSYHISFNKVGLIHINQHVCDLIGIKPGSKVTLAQDKKEPENWYIFLDPTHGFEVRVGYGDRGCIFNHSDLVRKFVESIGRDAGATHRFRIAQVPTEMKGSKTKYWGILIS